MKFSNRVSSMQQSPIRKLVPIAEAAKAKGKKVYHLNIGQPDIKTPDEFLKAIRDFDDEVLKYSFSQGIPELTDALIEYYKRYNIEYDRNDILITNGGSEALLFALLAVADNGDDVLVPEPFYTNYNGFATAIGVNINAVTTKATEGFHLPSKDAIVAKLTPKTRAILLSNPGNPTGVVYTTEEIEMIASIAKEHDLYIIADEVYREFVYDGLDYTSFGNVKGIEDRVIIVDSISKRYSACGARIGSLASKNKDLIAQILKLCQGRLCVPTLEQIGAVELYNVPQSYFKEVHTEYDKRRNIVFNALKEIPGVICEKPTGAFYVIAKLPIENAEEFVIWMLKEFDDNGETVMFAPAEGFYRTPGLGKDEIRIAYILNETDLTRAMDILKKGIEAYKNR